MKVKLEVELTKKELRDAEYCMRVGGTWQAQPTLYKAICLAIGHTNHAAMVDQCLAMDAAK